MSKEKKKSVQPAEAPQPSEAAAESAVAAPAEPKSFSELLRAVPEDKIQVAESFGIPVRALVAWADSVDARFGQVEEAFKTVGVALKNIAPLGDLVQRMQQQGNAPTPAPTGGSGLSDLKAIASILGGGGDSSASLMNEKLMALAFENFGLGNALLKAIILKTAPDFADQILRPAGAGKT